MNDLPRESASSAPLRLPLPADNARRQEEISALFSMLDPRDVEQFYRAYQLWSLQRQISQLQTLIASHQRQLAQNAARLQELHPSPIALAALAQLQANGVNDIDLLERMLERGEDWLDRTMQRLAYCEKSALISDNFSEWCEHALEGAYDWIDSLQDNPAPSEDVPPAEASSHVESIAAAAAPGEQITEAMLLQKLMSDGADEGSIERVAAGSPTDEPTAIDHAGEELIQPAEQLETVPAVAAQAQEAPSAPEHDVAIGLVEEIATVEVAPQDASVPAPPAAENGGESAPGSSAETDQEHEELSQPTPRWRKRGFFQWLFGLFRS
jgi:hypothetical protein